MKFIYVDCKPEEEALFPAINLENVDLIRVDKDDDLQFILKNCTTARYWEFKDRKKALEMKQNILDYCEAQNISTMIKFK